MTTASTRAGTSVTFGSDASARAPSSGVKMANVSISGTRNQNGGHRRRAEGQQDVVMVRHAGLQPARVLSAHPDDCSSAFGHAVGRSEEHTSELQSLMRISYAVFCLQKKNT